MKLNQVKIGFYIFVAGLAFLFRTSMIIADRGAHSSKAVLFLSISLSLIIAGVVLILTYIIRNKENNFFRKKRLIASISIGALVGFSSLMFAIDKKENEKKQLYDISKIVTLSVPIPYELTNIVSIKKEEFRVPEDLDAPYAAWGEGRHHSHKGWKAYCKIKLPNGKIANYGIYVSEKGQVIHTTPFDLIKKIKSESFKERN